MLATPHQNAVTEHSITPLCVKMSSVPLDGRIFKATTIDAELAHELENVLIHEQAGHKLQDSYIVFWYQLSALKNLSHIKACNLKTETQTPLFLDGGHWDPTLIPAALR
ncbi:hypothetical protein JVU11DRAFT_1088 [Chiua virens]|nr:hypothetical protein JVU11DRAFT_1088 [Chiua virens]